jgi:type III pantothenate kinase
VADDPPADLEEEVSQLGFYVRLQQDSLLPFQNTYRTPATIGKDRLAAVAGAQALFPSQNSLVIDAGTCMTSDFLERGTVFRGGNISPGVQMRLRAMHDYTVRLPLVNPQPLDAASLLGDSTETALRCGAVVGTALEVNALTTELEEQYGELQLLLTGGDASLLVPFLKKKIFVQPNLVLIGLKQILEYNAKHFD